MAAKQGKDQGIEKVFKIFRTTQEVLRAADERQASSSKSSLEEKLAKSVANLDDQAKLAYLLKTGHNSSINMSSAAYSWKSAALELLLSGFAREQFVKGQNEEVAGILGSGSIQATLTEEAPPTSIRRIADQGFQPSSGPVTGTVDSVRTDTNLILLDEGVGGVKDPSSLWNIPMLGREGQQLVELEFVPQAEQAAA